MVRVGGAAGVAVAVELEAVNGLAQAVLVLAALVGLLVFSLVALWGWGWWILRREGYRWRGVPMVYDGKGSYAAWAARMERARRVQAGEEAE